MRCCVFLAFNSVAPAELVKGPKDYIFLSDSITITLRTFYRVGASLSNSFISLEYLISCHLGKCILQCNKNFFVLQYFCILCPTPSKSD